jgi:hypothetical protein
MLTSISLPRSKAFEDLVKTSHGYLAECQEALLQEYLLGSWPRYDWSQVTRQLVFSDGGQRKVVADIQFVGSVSPETETWLWAWDNNSVDPELCGALLQVREYGEIHGFPHLATPKWHAHEVDGWEMTAIAAFLLRAKGAYRSRSESGYTFMIMTAVGWVT